MKKPLVVLDTNVAVTANSVRSHADTQCVLRCLEELNKTQQARRLLLDEGGLILKEYLDQRPHGFPQGAGDAFLVWVYDNQANPKHIRIVPITPLTHDPRGFAEFPDDVALAEFDADDRKFVAVALASGDSPPILNATDTDWWIHRAALKRHGVVVEFLCQHMVDGS